MKEKEAKDFELLKNNALSFIKYALKLCPVSDSLVENYKTAEFFVHERLLSIKNMYRDAYISDDVKQHFNFKNKERDNLIKQANGWMQNGKENDKVGEDDNGVEEIDSVTLDLIESLEIQTEKGLLACEKWVSNNKISITKVPPELLAKKLVDLREKNIITVILFFQSKKSFCYMHMRSRKYIRKYSELIKSIMTKKTIK